MTTLDPQEFHRISDRALVTYIRMNGYDPQQVAYTSGTCYWYFRTSESLNELVDIYNRDEAEGNVREFNKEFNKTLREFRSASSSRE